jgi:hypothetical protein
MKTCRRKIAFLNGVLLGLFLFAPVLLMADGNWPKEIKTAKSSIIIYQPQPDSMKGDHLYSRAAISFTTPKITNPVFGAVWSDSKFSTDRQTGTCTIFDVKILNVRFPGIDTLDPARVQNFKKLLEDEATKWEMEFSLDELKSSLAINKAAVSKSSGFKNDPPEIIFIKQNSVLLLFDGDPVFKPIDKSTLKRAINTPFLVLQDTKDNSYYLYGSDYWYKAADPVKATWKTISNPPQEVVMYLAEVKKQAEKTQTAEKKPSASKPSVAPAIIVRTKSAELIESTGEPQFAPIQETQLLYMTNTDDNIFMTIDKNQYYVLLSGRWYKAASLKGPWAFIDAETLPADFAKIPEGSAKDIVLASVPGTDAAKDAVMDAQIPQTAAVDRKTAKCEVKYDGDPKFETIKGTDLARAMNTNSTVLLMNNKYYVCDNAVWFVGSAPMGPWLVATAIPDEIQKIPPEDPAYNVKYVYIYDVQPEVVYVGYTPGYMGCYVYGPTVVYGTGWVYPPFYGPYYYPHPVTFGFSMHYNPWCGWSMGFSMSVGFISVGFGVPMGYPGGWWGPPMYHPPYHPPYNHYYGSRPPAYRGGGNTVNINYTQNNIYNKRTDGSAKPARQPAVSTRPATGDRPGAGQSGTAKTKPGTNPNTRDVQNATKAQGKSNNVYTDKKGDVYRNNNGDWQKNNGKDWNSVQSKPGDKAVQPRLQDQGSGFNRQEMDKQNAARERGTQNTNNRSSFDRSSPSKTGNTQRMGTGGGGGGGRRK